MSTNEDIEDRLVGSFCCMKCRGKTAVSRRVQLGRSIPELFVLAHGRYILLTCTLCGFTEFYDPAVYLANAEEAETAGRIAKASETTT